MTNGKNSDERSITVGVDSLGKWLFLLGLVLSVIVALVPDISEWVVWTVIILGLVGGWLFIQREDELSFFIVTFSLAVFSSSLFNLPSIGAFLTDVLDGVVLFLGAAVIAVAIRAIISWFR